MVLWVFGHARWGGTAFGNGDGLDDDDSPARVGRRRHDVVVYILYQIPSIHRHSTSQFSALMIEDWKILVVESVSRIETLKF
jgi:hypothetical protein